jgi:archaellin
MRRSIRKKGMSAAMLIVEIAGTLVAIWIIMFLIDHINATREHGFSIPKETVGMAKTGFAVQDVTGFSTDGNNSDLEAVMITVKTLKSSDAINLKDSIVYLQVGNRTARLHIVNGTTTRDETGGYYTG